MVAPAVENLWGKKISRLTFSLYLFDKNKARIGEGWLNVENVTPGQTVKFQTMIGTSGVPVSAELEPSSLPKELQPLAPPRKVSITVNSVPQGAALSVDSETAGTTPRLLQLAVGKHTLGFAKDGFTSGKYSVEIGPDDASGGSVSYELGSAAHDTIELRDGSVLTGDLVSVSGMQVEIRIGGNAQTFDRNQVKRILLTERSPASK